MAFLSWAELGSINWYVTVGIDVIGVVEACSELACTENELASHKITAGLTQERIH